MAGTEDNWQDGAHNYRAFLLRCWQEGQDGGESDASFVWRFALVPIDDEPNPKGFACLEDLFGYLHGQLIHAGRPAINQGGSLTVWSKPPRLEISIRKDENES